jgi:hypothetical protein
MARGGKRPGAGRKPGAGKGEKTTRQRRLSAEIADRARAEGRLPLDVLLEVMRVHFDAQRWQEAVEVAQIAAPYCHPRLQAIEYRGTTVHLGAEDLDDAALAAVIRGERP